jgi:ankyrin repeat protein
MVQTTEPMEDEVVSREIDIDLWNAATTGNIELMNEAIQSGADIHLKKPGLLEDAAIHLACRAGHTQAVQWLLDQGANIEHLGGR